jgi:hypothetical protein
MENKFGGMAVQKRKRVRTQHGVPTDHLANMGCPNVCCRQPRPRYAGVEDKFIIENEPINHFASWHDVWKEFPTAQAYAITRDADVKLDTLDFQGYLQHKRSTFKENIQKYDKKNVPREAMERKNQSN